MFFFFREILCFFFGIPPMPVDAGWRHGDPDKPMETNN